MFPSPATAQGKAVSCAPAVSISVCLRSEQAGDCRCQQSLLARKVPPVLQTASIHGMARGKPQVTAFTLTPASNRSLTDSITLGPQVQNH